jgi:hypothetical protein
MNLTESNQVDYNPQFLLIYCKMMPPSQLPIVVACPHRNLSDWEAKKMKEFKIDSN